MFMRLQSTRTAQWTQPNEVTLKDAVQQDHLIQLRIIVSFARKKTKRKIWEN